MKNDFLDYFFEIVASNFIFFFDTKSRRHKETQKRFFPQRREGAKFGAIFLINLKLNSSTTDEQIATQR
jgi:hypothetical protein